MLQNLNSLGGSQFADYIEPPSGCQGSIKIIINLVRVKIYRERLIAINLPSSLAGQGRDCGQLNIMLCCNEKLYSNSQLGESLPNSFVLFIFWLGWISFVFLFILNGLVLLLFIY